MFNYLAIVAVAGDCNNIRTTNTSGERLTDCPPTNYESGRYSFLASETISRSGFGLYNHADRSILTKQGQSDSRSHRRETQPQKGRVSRRSPVETQQLDRYYIVRTDRHPESICFEVYCSVQPRPPAIDFDSGFVYSDPLRLRLRRVRNAVSYSMYPLKDRLLSVVRRIIAESLVSL